MDIFKIKLYLEVLSIALFAVNAFYIIPTLIILGITDHLGIMIGAAAIGGYVMWKTNATFHQLLAKWGKK